jgi:superoxide reductase
VRSGEAFEVEVEVGQALPHPADHRHFIQFIEVYADELFLSRVDFAAGRTSPRLTISVVLQHPARELRAFGNCNLHGIWVGRKAITVVVGTS